MATEQGYGSAWIAQQMMVRDEEPSTIVGQAVAAGALVLLRADEFNYLIERSLALSNLAAQAINDRDAALHVLDNLQVVISNGDQHA